MGTDFSTISYSSKEELKVILDDLVSCGVLNFYIFIEHEPEDGETKKHIHLFVSVKKLVGCSYLDTIFDKCMKFIASNLFDWYLYGLHDKAYLSIKWQSRKHHYKTTDFITNNEFVLERLGLLNGNTRERGL